MKYLHKVALIGSGNWGSAIAKIIGNNTVRHAPLFDPEVRMWTFEEMVEGEKLTRIINTKHENVKYLPGVKLPENVVAVPDLKEACLGANVLVFVVPHQFVKKVCSDIRGHIAPGCRGISLIKGVDTSEGGLQLISDIIHRELGIEMAVLSGANIASEVAMERFCETTIGCRTRESGDLYQMLFHTPSFRVSIVEDSNGVELCGALKNIVAVAAGIVDGLRLGDNTKAAIIRIGLMEIKRFSQSFYPGVKSETFFESCGVADLITTCYGGRNRKVAEAHVLTGKSFEQLEQEMLNGQKLQGTLTAKEVYSILEDKQMVKDYPLFVSVYRVCYEGLAPAGLIEYLEKN
ncbi:uncharacterized protein VTP21DRAFT_897 [Calcarisporiella thermophila]|uniref:uncharacterized protein n=1 Tax=Calcarisporiella thermophila TaxID=911321 RepID=UPI00374445BB